MKLILTTMLILAGISAVASAQTCDNSDQPSSSCKLGRKLLVVGTPAEPPSLTGASEVDIVYTNKFRYSVSAKPTAPTSIAAAKVPSQLTPATGAGSAPVPNLPQAPAAPGAAPKTVVPTEGGIHALNELIITSTGQVAAGLAIPTDESACNQTNPGWPTALQDRIDRIDNCWIYIRGQIENDKKELNKLATDINTAIRSVAAEQSCYSNLVKQFPDVSLGLSDANRLVAVAQQNPCIQNMPWPDANKPLIDLGQRQDELNDLTTAPGYPDWLKQPGYADANTALVKQVAALITQAVSYSTGAVTTGAGSLVTQNYTDWNAAQTSNLAWRDRLAAITSVGSLKFIEPIGHCNDFYGKGHSTTITVSATDVSSTAATPQTLTLATNTCLPASIASTGVGITFLPNPTYGFVAGDTAGDQVIGKTAVNDQAPVFAALYNVKLGRGQTLFGHGMEFFASPGVGFSTASSSTATDFLGGISLSIARRTLFFTPAVDFGQRTQLAPGFSLGTAKGMLTSVPTVTNWKAGFALVITFGVAPSGT